MPRPLSLGIEIHYKLACIAFVGDNIMYIPTNAITSVDEITFVGIAGWVKYLAD